MIYLDSSLNIQIDLSGAAAATEPEIHVFFKDEISEASPQAAYKVTQGQYQRAVTAGTTDTIICASPAGSYRRAVESIVFNNLDNAAVTVRIWTDDGTTERELFGPRSVAAGDMVWYEHGSGWGIT